MRRTIMMLFLFVMSIGIFAQESELEKKRPKGDCPWRADAAA